MIIEMDSLVLTNMINDQYHQKRFVLMLHKIDDLLSREWGVIIRHVYKEANCCANMLAILGANLNLGVHWLCAPLVDLVPMLQADLVGVFLPRLCNPQ